MPRKLPLILLLGLLLISFDGVAASYHGDGVIDNSDGTPNRTLRYEQFEITQDGYATGYIVNMSDRPLKAVRLDMWTTNPEETRIFWRKSLNVGDMAPRGKYEVREIYDPGPESAPRTKFKFRLPSNANYRNQFK